MIDLHYWPTPNGWKVSIMLEEYGLPYTLKPVNLGRGEQFSTGVLRYPRPMRPATARICRGAASQMHSAEARLAPIASENAST